MSTPPSARDGKAVEEGPKKSPMTTAGRNSTSMSAATHEPEFVRSLMSMTSANGREERPETRAERCEEEHAEARSGAQEAQLAAETGHPGASLSRSRCSRTHRASACPRNVELVRRADGDPDRVGRAEARERADDHALAEQRVEERLRASPRST